MRTEYKIGIIGYGGFGQFLHHAWQSHEQVDVIAVADIQKPVIIPDKIKFYTDYDTIIKNPELDIISVATPPDTHSQIAFAALKAGKHVLVEKPMALNIADAQEYKNRSRKANKIVMVDYMLRFNPIIMAIKALGNKGLFGELRRAAVENYAQDESLNPGHWFWDHSISGGIFVEHGVHFFDLINSFTDSWTTPFRILNRYLGQNATWYLHCHIACADLLYPLIEYLFFVSRVTTRDDREVFIFGHHHSTCLA